MMQPASLPFDPADAWRAPYAATPYDLWTRTNVGEVFPAVVTPLTFSIMVALGDAVFVQQPERTRYLPRDLFRDGAPPSAFRAIGGRMFYNTGLIHHVFTDQFGLPSWFWMLSLGGPQDPSGAYIEQRPLRPLRLLRNLPAILAEGRRQRAVVASFLRDQGALRAQAAALRAEDLAPLAPSALIERLARVARAAEAPEAQLFDGSAAALNAYGMLAGLCGRWCGDTALANDLVTGLATLETADATVLLWDVARAADGNASARAIIETAPATEVQARLREEPTAASVTAALDRFFARFGHRGADEFELSVPRWQEDPTFVLSTLRMYVNAPSEADPRLLLARQRRRRRAAEREARRRLANGTLSRMLPYRWWVFRSVLREARRLLPMRENPKHHFLLFAAELRRTILELARQLATMGLIPSAEDVFFLTREELAAAAEALERGSPAPALPAIIAARRSLYERYRAWSPPDAIPAARVEELEAALAREPDADPGRGEALTLPAERRGAAPNGSGNERAAGDGRQELQGIAASSGVITGRARVALTPDEGAAIEPGEVLVAPFTDPGWTPLFTVAGGIVMDLGGLLSHGAIVAREYGIPAVVNTRTATTRLRTGQIVTVDGDRGLIRWHEGARPEPSPDPD